MKHTSKAQWRLKQKLRTGNIIASRLNLGVEDKKAVEFMIKTIKNFKLLSKRESNETIIAALCFYCLKTRDTSKQIEYYSVLKEYGLNDKVYGTIVTHLANYYQKKVVVVYSDI